MNWFAFSIVLTALAVAVAYVALPAGWILPTVAVLLSTFIVVLGCGVAFIRMNFFMPAVCRGPAGRREIALTFDDGPDADSTPALLDVLKELNVRATFFCIGERVRAHPDIARRIVDEGHLIGNHSEHHGWWTNFLIGRRLTAELESAQRSIESATGTTPRYYRPPLGLMNPHYRRALSVVRLRLVGWDVRSFDLRRVPVDRIAERAIAGTRPGSIIALHDAGPGAQRVTALARLLIASMHDRGYAFVRVDRFDEGA